MYGYMGRLLEIDLEKQKVETLPLEEKLCHSFIGAKGLGLKILYDRVKEKIAPLSPENLLIIITGPLTGTLAPSSGRFSVVTKSPLTGIATDGHVGGYFGVYLKFMGIDGLIIKGKAEKPTYLYVKDGKVVFLSAQELWGRNVFEVDEELKKRHPKSSCAVIGVGGENKVKFACISFDKGRQAGRCGVGAVMGSKNLKAVVVDKGGKEKPRYKDEEGFKLLCKQLNQMLQTHPVRMKRHVLGTLLCVWEGIEAGSLPIKNFSGTKFKEIIKLVPERLWQEGIWKGTTTCYACPIKCTKVSELDFGDYKGKKYEAPEFEPTVLLGCNCGIPEYKWVVYGHILCNDLGLDAMSCGNVIGFLMECYEKGVVTEGINFGDGEGMIKYIKKIAYKEGIGEILAEGVKGASKIIGKNSEKFAIHIKGLELPGIDPRASYGMALALATADRGGCHQRAWVARAELYGKLDPYSTEGKALFVKRCQDERAVCFSLDLCDFMPFEEKTFVEMLRLGVGIDMGVEEYLKVGERIWNLARMFAVREGISRKEDTLPPRLMEEPIKYGPAQGKVITKEILNTMLNEYYKIRGWNEEGIPTEEKLKELGLK
jgi:aldehyde:ferredoxin oxidoreductase